MCGGMYILSRITQVVLPVYLVSWCAMLPPCLPLLVTSWAAATAAAAAASTAALDAG